MTNHLSILKAKKETGSLKTGWHCTFGPTTRRSFQNWPWPFWLTPWNKAAQQLASAKKQQQLQLAPNADLFSTSHITAIM